MDKKIVGFSVSTRGLLIIIFPTQVAVFLHSYMHLFRFQCRADRKLVLIRVEVFIS